MITKNARRHGVPPISNLGGTSAVSEKWVEHGHVRRFWGLKWGCSKQKPTSIDGGHAVGNGRAVAREILSWRERRAATTEMRQ